MKTTDVHESRRRFCTRIGCVLIAAALCFVSLAVFSTPVSAATQNSGITSGKVYRIINLGSGKYLNVTGGRDQDDINVNQYTGDGTNTQDFVIRWISAESCYKIYPVCSSNGSGRVLHIARSGSAPVNGGNLVIKTASSGDAASQRFQIDTVGFNLFYIRPVSNTSLYLTANGNSNGTWTGTGANTSGNVVAKTLSTGTPGDERYQKWIIIEKTQYSNYPIRVPVEDYQDGFVYTTDGIPCNNDENGDPKETCHNNCISFWGGGQCLAFAREIYARYFGGFRLSDDNATGEACSGYVNNIDVLKNYIRNNVGIGGHVRVIQSLGGEHSLIVANFNNTRIWVYDANSNKKCTVRSEWMTYEQFASSYSSIKYSHKGKHTHTHDTYKKLNNEQHAKFCTKCNFSSYSTSTVLPHVFNQVKSISAYQHATHCRDCGFRSPTLVESHSFVLSGTLYRCTVCGYTTSHAPGTQNVSDPMEVNAISEPEQPDEIETGDTLAEVSAEEDLPSDSPDISISNDPALPPENEKS